MARIVLGIGTSHSPMLASPPEDYPRHAEIDAKGRRLLDKAGRPCTYGDLLAAADPAIADQIRPEVLASRAAQCNAGLERLAGTLASAALDALIIIGDDQHEQFFDDNMPSILVYWGEAIENRTLPLPQTAPAFWKKARAQYHEAEGPRSYPVASQLGRHLIEVLRERDFDISHSRRLMREHGEGHAFGFVHRRLMRERPVPVVPVILNTYFPPNQPRPQRCYRLGETIAEAVRSWPGDARVGVLASGGLSHFTVDEELDRRVLAACGEHDRESLVSIPEARLNSGSSEIRNWIATAGAVEALDMRWHDYVPCYRSPAGTGCGMGFALWS
ncbi:MAG TPA: extradiol ring-cleavage dioxygenase [Alphaproteobacteria bacterium]|nr:extradiol ring-cleavage dioxygenase [Alphaproteobacteria bacterium]